MGVCQKMTQDDKGGGGVRVWNGPKKDDVIYEQPLRELLFIYLSMISNRAKKEILPFSFFDQP